MIIAEIVRVKQPEVYNLLNKIYAFGVIHIEIEEDEGWEFKQYKEMMEKPRGVAL